MEELLKIYSSNDLEINNIKEQISIVIAELKYKQNELKRKKEEIKEKIKKAMEENGVKNYENDYISLTYVAPTTRRTVDSKLLKEKYVEIYEECSKISDVKSSIRIKIKNYNTTPEVKIIEGVETILD